MCSSTFHCSLMKSFIGQWLLLPFTYYYHPLPTTITLYLLLLLFTYYYHPLPTTTIYLRPPFTSADVHKLHVNVVLPTFKGLNSVPFSFFTCGVKCQSDVYHSYTAMATAMRNELDAAYERDKEAAHQAMEDGQIEPLPSVTLCARCPRKVQSWDKDREPVSCDVKCWIVLDHFTIQNSHQF